MTNVLNLPIPYKYKQSIQYGDCFMDYKKIADKIISNRRKLGDPDGYSEVHHILPRSFGGTDDKNNLIQLTAKEHFVIHRLLAKIFPNTGMVHSIYKMACSKKYKVTSKVYETLRKAHANRVSTDTEAARKKSVSLAGRPQSPEHIAARTASRKESGSWHSEDTKKKISAATIGRSGVWTGKKLPADVVAKRNASRHANGTYACSEERKQLSSAKQKGIKKGPRPVSEEMAIHLTETRMQKVVCPHCNTIGSKMVMTRWHFNNCKKKEKYNEQHYAEYYYSG